MSQPIEFKLYPKQQRALMSPAQEILYGGAAGAGKSYMMRVLAMVLALEVPHLKVFLFRRMYRELYINHVNSPDGFMTMMKPLLDDGDVVFNKSDGVFNFWNGAQIYLCHAQHEADIKMYLGAEMHVLLIDEATQFTEKMIRFLRTRVRLGSMKVPEKWAKVLPKIIYGTNPGGVSHRYFKKGFVNVGSGQVFRAPVNDGGMLREFIPALSKENLIQVKNDPNYEDRIRGVGDDRLIGAYLEGNWDLEEGAAFGDLWDTNLHIIDSLEVPRTWRIDRSHDYGYSAPCATIWTAESDGTAAIINHEKTVIPRKSLIVVSELYLADKEDMGLKLLPYEIGTRMANHEINSSLRPRTEAGPADTSIFDRDRGMQSIHDQYLQKGMRFTAADKRPGSRERGFVLTRQMLKARIERNVEQPWLMFMRHCVNTCSQIPELPIDPENPQDVNSAANDHVYDALRYRVLKSVTRGGTGPVLGY